MAIWETQLSDMDTLTFKGIMKVQFEDVETLVSHAKGKQREGTITDKELALQFYVEDLANSDVTLNDRTIAQGLARQSLGDVSAIEEEYRRQQQIIRDHELARYLARSAGPSPSSQLWRNRGQVDAIDPLRDLWPILLESDSDDSAVAESSAWAGSRKIRNKKPKGHCVAC